MSNWFATLRKGFTGCFMVLALPLISACAPTPYFMPESDLDSTAPGEALLDFSIRKPMPHRVSNHAFEFYYKHCAVAGPPEFTINPYECNTPFY